MMGYVISVVNHKGGVGKTAFAMLLAAGFDYLQQKNPELLPEELREKPILAIDNDPQGNMSEGMGFLASEMLADITDAYEEIVKTGKITKNHIPIMNTYKNSNIKLIPATIRLEDMSSILRSRIEEKHVLKMIINAIRDDYSIIVVDTPPYMGVFSQNAIVASDYVVIPIILHMHSIIGIPHILNFIRNAQYTLNEGLKPLGIIINAYDKRYRLQKALYESVNVRLAEFIYSNYIPTNSKLVENISMHKYPFSSMTTDTLEAMLNVIKETVHRMSIEYKIPDSV